MEFGTHYLDNGCKYRLGCNEAPVYLWVNWPRDLRRNVTLKGQGHDLSMLTAEYLEKSWR